MDGEYQKVGLPHSHGDFVILSEDKGLGAEEGIKSDTIYEF